MVLRSVRIASGGRTVRNVCPLGRRKPDERTMRGCWRGERERLAAQPAGDTDGAVIVGESWNVATDVGVADAPHPTTACGRVLLRTRERGGKRRGCQMEGLLDFVGVSSRHGLCDCPNGVVGMKRSVLAPPVHSMASGRTAVTESRFSPARDSSRGTKLLTRATSLAETVVAPLARVYLSVADSRATAIRQDIWRRRNPPSAAFTTHA